MSYLLFLILACGEKTSDTNTIKDEESTSDTGSIDTGEETSDPSMTAGECTPLNEEECVISEDCTSIMAAPLTYNETDSCWISEEKVFTQCMSIDMTCGEAEIYARPDPDASCMLFSNTCIPLEWDICDALNFSECVD